MKHLFIVLLTATLASGCTHRLGDFTIISSKNVDLSHGAEFKRANARVKGEDMVFLILGIPTGMPNMKTALDHAIEKNPYAVGLVDGVVTHKRFSFILFGEEGFEVEGTPLIDGHLEKR